MKGHLVTPVRPPRYAIHDYKIVQVTETDDDGMARILVVQPLWTYEKPVYRTDYWVYDWQLWPLNSQELARLALDRILEDQV